jgi:spoIIIJ-associated protein
VQGGADAKAVEEFLVGLLKHMEIEASMEITQDTEGVNVALKTDDPGTLIGRRGETIDAIQHITNYAVNRGRSSNRVRVSIDAENYRQRRNETLENLADRTAGKVLRYRRNLTLDPMNAYERHVIHTALQGRENISTYSVGEEPNRRVVVAYGRRVGDDNRGGGTRYGGSPRPPRPPTARRPEQGDRAAPSSHASPQTQTATQTQAPPQSEPPKYREWS